MHPELLVLTQPVEFAEITVGRRMIAIFKALYEHEAIRIVLKRHEFLRGIIVWYVEILGVVAAEPVR